MLLCTFNQYGIGKKNIFTYNMCLRFLCTPNLQEFRNMAMSVYLFVNVIKLPIIALIKTTKNIILTEPNPKNVESVLCRM